MIARRIILHCTDSPNGHEYPIDKLRADHLARGFKDIGYHLVIQPDGSITYTRSLNAEGAHCKGENYDSIGVCLVGSSKFSLAQFRSLRYQLDGIFQTYSIPKWAIYCHYQFKSAQDQQKTCPNMDSHRILYWYNHSDAAALASYIL